MTKDELYQRLESLINKYGQVQSSSMFYTTFNTYTISESGVLSVANDLLDEINAPSVVSVGSLSTDVGMHLAITKLLIYCEGRGYSKQDTASKVIALLNSNGNAVSGANQAMIP